MDLIPTISVDEWDHDRDNYTLIDVRSPKEYSEFHIPAAVNLPIFSNDERAEVGTIYKQKGKEAAKDLGMKIASAKLPRIYQEVKSFVQDEKEIVFYCWRGGMRSRSIATVMKMMGIACYQLSGGIRSLRRKIVKDLEAFAEMEKSYYVLEGCTGTRKTDLLLKLYEKDYPVIDLEGLAGHRGSIFGAVGMNPRSQKQFECDLWERLNKLKDVDYYIIEGESKRIGNVILPPFLINGKEEGTHFLIEYPFQKRVQAILDTYQPDAHGEDLYQAFCHLKKYLTPLFIEEIERAFAEKNYHELISMLLEHYYDPKYLYKIDSYSTKTIPILMETLNEGLEKIEGYLQKQEIGS